MAMPQDRDKEARAERYASVLAEAISNPDSISEKTLREFVAKVKLRIESKEKEEVGKDGKEDP